MARQHVQEGSGETTGSEESRKKIDDKISRLTADWNDGPTRKERAVKAANLRTHIMSHFHQHFNGFDDAKKKLSSPESYISLPFPYAGPALPSRFKFEYEDVTTYKYMGREIFSQLFDVLTSILQGGNLMDLWVFGPIGYGKSHLLATMTYLLTAQGYRVIYLPDCRFCEKDPFCYVQTAMFFAWGDDPVKLGQIKQLRSQDDIQEFLSHNANVLFIIDQINALDEKSGEHTKNKVLEWMDRCRSGSKTLLSTSANNTSYVTTRHQQNNEKTFRVYGGFTKARKTMNAYLS